MYSRDLLFRIYLGDFATNLNKINRRKMKITEMTDQHLRNRIKFFERRLLEKPALESPGDGSLVDDWVHCEIMHNERVEEDILKHIENMKTELKERNI